MLKRIFWGLVAAPLFLLLAMGVKHESPVGAEVERIQHHLSRVAGVLHSQTPEGITEEQLEARSETLVWLDEYRAAGVFPHNHVRRGERVPIFVDPHGTPCAVGYLLLRSGEHELVERIVRTDNLIRVPDLRGDARVGSWLEARGLTFEEAALIQPTYARVSSNYKATTVGLSIVTAALASHAAIAEPAGGASWIDALTIGATLGHTYMILDSRDRLGKRTWVELNFLGMVAGVASEVVRIARRRGSDGERPESSDVQTYVRPGRNGTEIGFAIRH